MEIVTDRASRESQLERLASFEFSGKNLIFHGSIGHAAMMGTELPGLIKNDGTVRDIDIFMGNTDKLALEAIVEDMGAGAPAPIDAGLSSLLVVEGRETFASKGGVTTRLFADDILEETEDHEVRGTDGICIRTFSPVGALIAHSLEPGTKVRIDHIRPDMSLLRWFRSNDVTMPREVKLAIQNFHDEYRRKYPYGPALTQASKAYIHIVPEEIRKVFRQCTHRIMNVHAGRKTPYVE